MNKSRKISNMSNVITYDETGHLTAPAGLTIGTAPASSDNSTKAATTAWIRTYVGSLSYATSASVTTAISNLVNAAPTTLDTLNELAAALGNDPNFATTVTASIGTKVPQARTITINGTAYDLSADRSWTIASGVTSFNSRTGAITLTSGDVTGALGYTPYNSSNPSGYITGISSGMVTTALGYTPYNSSNPSGYITSSGSISGSAGSVSGLTLNNSGASINPDNVMQNQIGYNTSVSLFGQTDGGLYSSAYNGSWIHQIYGDFRTGQIAIRGKNSGTWQSWRTVIDSGNIGSYKANGSIKLWAESHPNDYYLVNNWTGAHWYITSNHGSPVRVGYADTAGSATDSSKLPLGGGTLTGTVSVNGGYSFVSNGYNNNGGFAMNNAGQYWGLMNNFGTNDWRLGRGSHTSQNGGWNLRWDAGDNVFINQHLYLNNNYGSTIVGVYSSTIYQGVWAMGDAYKLPLNGSSTGSLYGLAWSHPNAGGVAGNLNTHGLLVMENGTFLAAISGSIRARDDVRAPALYDSGSRVAISRGEGRQYVEYSRYVYNNGAYSGSGWIEPSDLGVRYASSSGYASSAGSLSGFDKTNPSFGAVYADNWFRAYGDCGLYSQSYGGHIRRSNGSSFGNWETFGYERNGWSGFCYVHNYLLNIMSNTSGDHGFYQENGNGWTLFYNRANNCWGIGTDNTYSGDGFRCVKYGSAQYGWTTWSDRRAKENISTITGALDTVLSMRGVYYNYIQDEAKVQRVGFIAQELMEVLPQAVRYAEDIDEYNVNYDQIVSVLAEAIKEQQSEITELKTLVQQLLNR